MVERPDALLDLSDWPALPTADVPSGLPPRPVPRGRPALPRPRLTGPRTALALLAAGTALLLVPLGGCGPVLSAWAASPRPLPRDVPPVLDDAATRADADAVSRARAALAAWRPTAPAPAVVPSPRPSRTVVGAADAREVAADQQAVDAAAEDATAAQQELDTVLAEQEASEDPGQYDGQVSAAREELDRAVATLDEARRALAAAKARTRTVTVAASSSPRPAAPATPAPTPAARAELAAALADAEQVQAAHLAVRARAVADWRAGHEQQVALVSAHNARVRSCAGRAAAPASGGTGLVVLGAGLLLRRRR